MRFCDYIRERRELMGLSQKDLAMVLSVDVPMYSRYERGQRMLKDKHIPIIAIKLNIDCEELRQMWIADKVYRVVYTEKNVTQIFEIVAENINELNRE